MFHVLLPGNPRRPSEGTNLEGLMIYSKGKLAKEAGVETYYFLISSKKAL
jgi:hypothetical protein